MGGVPDPLNVNLSGALGTVGPVGVNPITVNSVGPIGPVTLAGLDNIHINIDKLPKILIGVDPVSLHLDPIDFSMRIKEIPNVRMHLPANFGVGLSLLGMELLCVRLCGEAQVITEPYVPNQCERCGAKAFRINQPDDVPVISVTDSG